MAYGVCGVKQELKLFLLRRGSVQHMKRHLRLRACHRLKENCAPAHG
jgi:hypothetical protein